MGALLFVAMLRWVPDLYDSLYIQADKKNDAGIPAGWDAVLPDGEEPLAVEPFPKNLIRLNTQEAVTPTGQRTAPVVFSKLFWEYLLLIFLAFLGLVPCQRFFSLYVEEYVKIEASAGLWALSAMAEIPLLLISGKLIRSFDKERLLVVCLFSIVIRNCCYIFIPGIVGAVGGQLLHSLSFGLFHPLGVLLCVLHSRGNTVTAMTFFTSANGVAYIIGSMIGGYIIEYLGYPALFLLFSVFPAIGIGFYFITMQCKR